MADLITILKQAGFSGERLREAYAIAMRESGGRPDAHNDNRATGDDSRGIFQINMLDDLGPARDAKFKQYVKGYSGIESLFDPVVNARAAAYMSRKGEDWTSWVSPQYGAAAQHYANYPGDNSTGSDIAPQGAAPTDRSAGKKPKDTPQTAEEAAAANSISWDFVLAHPVIPLSATLLYYRLRTARCLFGH